VPDRPGEGDADECTDTCGRRTCRPAAIPGQAAHFLRYTTRGLTDEQAAQQTTASELSPGGLIKHVALTEQQWMRFIVDGPAAMSWG
jgi:hypothetical protein